MGAARAGDAAGLRRVASAGSPTLLQTFTRTPAGYDGFNLARYGLCLAVMLPSTFCAGMTLPLLTKSLLTNGWGERAIGWVYGVNTLGSILGVVLAGLVLLPLARPAARCSCSAPPSTWRSASLMLRLLGRFTPQRRAACGAATALAPQR